MPSWAIAATFFTVMAASEWLRPRRAPETGWRKRWLCHLGFFVTNVAVARLVAFLVAVPLAASWAESAGFGLLNVIALPLWGEWLVVFVLLDLLMWAQHLAMHHVPLLWRMHKVHHADSELDVTTALRFHPFELIASTLYKSGCVVLLGAPAALALAFELWLNLNAMFNHSNVALPRPVDRIIRWFIVTPDVHLVHHSRIEAEQRRNFGFALTLWDRMFGTYRSESQMGRGNQNIGLDDFTVEDARAFTKLMKVPFA